MATSIFQNTHRHRHNQVTFTFTINKQKQGEWKVAMHEAWSSNCNNMEWVNELWSNLIGILQTSPRSPAPTLSQRLWNYNRDIYFIIIIVIISYAFYIHRNSNNKDKNWKFISKRTTKIPKLSNVYSRRELPKKIRKRNKLNRLLQKETYI